MKLYSYFRSSASYRVRIALNLKCAEYTIEPVNLADGEQGKSLYLEKNSQGLVPALELDNGKILTQSIAIIEFLDQIILGNRLIPEDKILGAQARALASAVISEMQPLNNLRVLKYLGHVLDLSNEQVTDWYHNWVKLGFDFLEDSIKEPFCLGEEVSLVDCCLVPQTYNAYRFKFDVSKYPKIETVYRNCLELQAFQNASPEAQLDFTKSL